MDDGREGGPVFYELAIVSFAAGLLLLLPRQWPSAGGCIMIALLLYLWHREQRPKVDKLPSGDTTATPLSH